MRHAVAFTVALLSIAPASAQPAPPADRFDIAITVDDLPAHGALPQGMTRVGIARSYLATLKKHGVPQAYGFVNAVHLQEEPDSAPVLALWRKAGYPLGNHTYSHLNLDHAPSLEAWEADLERGEPPIAAQMQGADWHWLRFPNLGDGATPALHDGAAAYLAQHGYKVADVSISFSDWAYTDTYARCVAKHDDAAIASMKADYLRSVDEGIVWMKAASKATYGRVIPQVLLTHVGGWSAMMLPEVMARLDAAGAHYVPLAKAEADPAYAMADRLPGGGGIMERYAKAQGVDLSKLGHPAPPRNLATLCR
jgi:peptidoglycan/xylan/chitin deacetylase (PgdA/CDA1 family)